MGIELNYQQKQGVDDAFLWYKKQTEQLWQLSGPAGSGKTSVVSFLTERLGLRNDEVLFMAYVGKAAMVLSMKGNFAKTIHSAIYELVDVQVLDEHGKPVYKHGRPKLKKKFKKRDFIGKNIKLIVVDEAPMVPIDIAEDILSFGIPVIALGDLNQLPPIFGKPFFLQRPDCILTEIMRQSKDSPIIMLSQMALSGIDIPCGKYGKQCLVIDGDRVTDDMMRRASIIICAKNMTRDNINYHVRHNIYGIDKRLPVIGDKLICRKNNWNESLKGISLINGLVGYVENVDLSSLKNGTINIDFRPEFFDTDVFMDIPIDLDYLFMSRDEKDKLPYSPFDKANKFEFGHGITTHLSQGSQYDNVLLFEERMGDKEFRKKLLYTGITRAVDGLIIVKYA